LPELAGLPRSTQNQVSKPGQRGAQLRIVNPGESRIERTGINSGRKCGRHA
jgi:hypothetical protein